MVMKARQCGHMRRGSITSMIAGRARAVWYNRKYPMVKTEREYREDICKAGPLVFQKGWVAANDGNITIRLDADRILATPTGRSKGLMSCEDLITADTKGNKRAGRA